MPSARTLRSLFAATLMLAALALLGRAAAAEGTIPEPLKPWIPWVLRGEASCAARVGADGFVCAWLARLDVRIAKDGAQFVEEVTLDDDAWVPLPGGDGAWPTVVEADRAVLAGGDRRLAVIAHPGPTVRLPPGRFRLEGKIPWTSEPATLAVPDAASLTLARAGETRRVSPHDGVIDLATDGAPSAPPPSSSVQGSPSAAKADVVVSRKLTDDVPMILDTRVHLEVSGPTRELLLGSAVPAGFVAYSITGPARLRDGRLVVQASAGKLDVTVLAYASKRLDAVTLAASDGAWADHESWAFEQGHARVVNPVGPPRVTGDQTSAPQEWRSLALFSMKPGDTLRLESATGASAPATERLRLTRVLYLESDGVTWTALDRIEGTLARDTRFELRPELEHGRVDVDGAPIVQTKLPGSDAIGFNVPASFRSVVIESRLRGRSIALSPIVRDFEAATVSVSAPPDRELWLTRGAKLDGGLVDVDRKSVIVIALATVGAFWLLGWPYGLATFAWMLLSTSRIGSGAWSWAWIALLAAMLLARHRVRVERPIGWLRPLAFAGLLVAGALSLAPIAFELTASDRDRAEKEAEQVEQAAASMDKSGGTGTRHKGAEGMMGNPSSAANAPIAFDSDSSANYEQKKAALTIVDPNALPQTGHGTPRFGALGAGPSSGWPVHEGPLVASQRAWLLVVGPNAVIGLALVRLALLALIVHGLLKLAKQLPSAPDAPDAPNTMRGGAGSAKAAASVAAALLFLLTSAWARPAAAEIPDATSLADLKAQLTKTYNECKPTCADAPRLLLEVAPGALRARLEVHALVKSAVPLPGAASTWTEVSVDGKPAAALAREGTVLWVALEPGLHEIVLIGAPPAAKDLDLPLPLKPRRATAQVQGEGVSVDGLHEDGAPDDVLKVHWSGVPGSAGGAGDTSAAGDAGVPTGARKSLDDDDGLGAYVTVERTLKLTSRWELHTVVTRVSKPGKPLRLSVPLLPGETIVTAGTTPTSDAGGAGGARVAIAFGPTDTKREWDSTVEITPSFRWTAAPGVIESWSLAVGPLWLVETKGITQREAAGLRLFRPWPGETLAAEIVRPTGAEGASMTIESTTLSWSPALGRMTYRVAVSSSVPGRATFTLPEGLAVGAFEQDPRRPVTIEGRAVSVDVPAGASVFTLPLTGTPATGLMLRPIAPSLGLPVALASVRIEFDKPVWAWAQGGAAWGAPGARFWLRVLLAAALAALAARVREIPLPTWALCALSGVGSLVAPQATLALVAFLVALALRRERRVLDRRAANGVQLAVLAVGALAVGLFGLALYAIAIDGKSPLPLTAQVVFEQDRLAAGAFQPWCLWVPSWTLLVIAIGWVIGVIAAAVRAAAWAKESLSMGGVWLRAQGTPTRATEAPDATAKAPSKPHDGEA
jgi:hypothetical protein